MWGSGKRGPAENQQHQPGLGAQSGAGLKRLLRHSWRGRESGPNPIQSQAAVTQPRQAGLWACGIKPLWSRSILAASVSGAVAVEQNAHAFVLTLPCGQAQQGRHPPLRRAPGAQDPGRGLTAASRGAPPTGTQEVTSQDTDSVCGPHWHRPPH